MEPKQFSTSSYVGGICFLLLSGSLLAAFLHQGGFRQKNLYQDVLVSVPENKKNVNEKKVPLVKEEKNNLPPLAMLHYPQTLDALDGKEAHQAIGEVFGEAKSKKEFKAFLNKYLGTAYLYHYVFYRRAIQAAQDLKISLSNEDIQTAANDKVASVLSNRRIQEKMSKLNLNPTHYETWFRRKFFTETLLDKLFEAPEVSDAYLKERFETAYGKEGRHYDIRQIMVVNRPRQSRFFPESQFNQERPQIELQIKERAKKTLEHLKANPEDWQETLMKESDDSRKTRSGGLLGPSFSEEKFGSEIYQAVLQAKEGDLFGPVRSDEGWHLLKVLGFSEEPKFNFRGIYFKGASKEPALQKHAENRAFQLSEQLRQASTPEEKERIFQEALKSSEDPISREKNGERGFLGREQIAYLYPTLLTLKEQEYSSPVPEQEGYWVVQKIGTQPNPKVAHIFYSWNYLLLKQKWLDEHFETEGMKKIQEIQAELKAGKSWGELFEAYSEAPALPNEEGGLYKNVRSQHYGEAFAEELRKMKIGEQRILKHDYGISLVEMVERKQAKFEDHRGTILERNKKNPRVRQYITTYLEKTYPVDVSADGTLSINGQTISLKNYEEYLFSFFFYEHLYDFLEMEALQKLAGEFTFPEAEIKAKLEKVEQDWVQKSFAGDPQKFQEYCVSHFTTVDDYLRYQRFTAERDALHQHLAQKELLNDSELQQAFEREYGYLQRDEQNRLMAVQYHIRQLLKYTLVHLSKEISPENFDEPTRAVFEEKKTKMAEGLLEELKQAPQNFETYVRQRSEDTRTKHLDGKLGSLDLYGREFEAAVRQAKEDEFGLVRSSVGLHIYKRLPDRHQEVECKHILKKFRANSKDNLKEKQKQEIERLKEELVKIQTQLIAEYAEEPERVNAEFYKRFGEFAKLHSEDTASAGKEGFIQGPLTRFVKPFADACTAAKPYEIVGPIESPYGFHLIVVEKLESAVQAAHILFRTDFQAYKEEQLQGKLAQIAREKVQKGAEELKKGVPFEDVAQKYSDIHGTAEESMLYNKRKYGNNYQQQVMRLKVGDVSEVVSTNLGFHVIQLQKAEPIYFEDKKEELLNQLKNTPIEATKKTLLIEREMSKAGIRGYEYLWHQ